MMKFFRKYTKHLLAVFMVLLLVVWLAGDALTSLMRSDVDAGVMERGQAFGQAVRVADMRPAFMQADLLDDLFQGPYWRMPWLQPLAQMARTQDPEMLGYLASQVRRRPLNNEEWYMLDAAARHAGVYVPAEAVAKLRSNLPAAQIDAVRDRNKVSLDAIDRALQSFLRVNQSFQLAVDAVKVSEADVDDLIRKTAERAKIVAAALEGKSFVDPNYQPTPEELKAQFEKYKDAASQPAESPQFGYQVPDAVQLEYVKVNGDKLGKRQKISDEEVYQYWVAHQGEFLRKTPSTSTAPTTRPKDEPYETFSEARAMVIEKLQQQRGREEALRIARDIISQLEAPWASAPTTTQPAGFKEIPESAKDPELYSKLVSRLSEKYPDALNYGRTQLSEQQLLQRDNPELARATALQGTDQQIDVARAAALVPGIDAQRTRSNERFFRNLFETATEPFVADNGDVYVIRTIAVKPRHAPEMEAVRSRLVEDVRRAKAMEEAERQARKLADAAQKEGLEKAFNADAALKEKAGAGALKTPPPFARQQLISWGVPQLAPASISGLGYDPELTKTVFSLVSQPASQPATATRPAATTQPVRVAVHPQRNQQRVVVVELLDILPVNQAEYDQQRGRAMYTLQFQSQIRTLSSYFSPEEIRARINWQDAPGMEPKPEPGEGDDLPMDLG